MCRPLPRPRRGPIWPWICPADVASASSRQATVRSLQRSRWMSACRPAQGPSQPGFGPESGPRGGGPFRSAGLVQHLSVRRSRILSVRRWRRPPLRARTATGDAGSGGPSRPTSDEMERQRRIMWSSRRLRVHGAARSAGFQAPNYIKINRIRDDTPPRLDGAARSD